MQAMSLIVVDLSQILSLGTDFAQALDRGVTSALLAIESMAVEEAPHATGNLVNSHHSQRTATGGLVTASAEYATYVHEGTGLFGPKRQRIVPRVKKALAWEAGGRKVVRRSVAGAKPNPWFDRARDKAQPVVEKIIGEVIP